MTIAPPRRILLVDDDPAGAELTVAALRMLDTAVEVEIVSDGEEALDYVFQRGPFAHPARPEPDAILLDLKMPKVDGHEVLRQIRLNPASRAMRVVVLTSSDQAADRARSRELRGDDYLVKPASIMELVELLRLCEPLGLSPR